MAKQVAVIGLGRFGSTVARELQNSGHDVVAIDKDASIINEASQFFRYSAITDSTHRQSLAKLGIPNDVPTVVVAIGTDVQASLLTTILLKEMGVPLIIARANDQLHEDALMRLGADRVVNPENETALKLAHDIFHTEIVSYMDLISTGNKDYGISKITPPENFFGKTLKEVGLPTYSREVKNKKDKGNGNDVIVLTIVRGLELVLIPSGDEVILRGDLLVIAGDPDTLEKAIPRST